MSLVYRLLASALPVPRKDWIRAHEAELATIEGRRDRIRWMLGVIPLWTVTLGHQLTHEPSTIIGGTLMRSVVATLSVVNIAAGVGLGALYLLDTNPPIVAALSAVLLVQGVFTMVLIAGGFDRYRVRARHLQLVGSTLALVVGMVGVLNGLVTNLAAGNVDQEGGPLTIALLLGIHGCFSILAFAREQETTAPSN